MVLTPGPIVQIITSVSVNAIIILMASAIAGFLAGRPFLLVVQRWIMGTVLAGLALHMAMEARK